jgi:hypothetical protein
MIIRNLSTDEKMRILNNFFFLGVPVTETEDNFISLHLKEYELLYNDYVEKNKQQKINENKKG